MKTILATIFIALASLVSGCSTTPTPTPCELIVKEDGSVSHRCEMGIPVVPTESQQTSEQEAFEQARRDGYNRTWILVFGQIAATVIAILLI